MQSCNDTQRQDEQVRHANVNIRPRSKWAADSSTAQAESQRYVTSLERHTQKNRVWKHHISISGGRQKPVTEEPRGGTETGEGRTKAKGNGTSFPRSLDQMGSRPTPWSSSISPVCKGKQFQPQQQGGRLQSVQVVRTALTPNPVV